MKIYRPKVDTYVIELNGLPYEVMKEQNKDLYEQLSEEKLNNPNEFELDLQPEPIPIVIPKSEIETLKENNIELKSKLETAERISAETGTMLQELIEILIETEVM